MTTIPVFLYLSIGFITAIYSRIEKSIVKTSERRELVLGFFVIFKFLTTRKINI